MYSKNVTLKYYDEKTEEIKELEAKELNEKLKDLLELLKRCVENLKEVGEYNLQSFEVSLSLKAGIFIITTEGAIKLKYEQK